MRLSFCGEGPRSGCTAADAQRQETTRWPGVRRLPGRVGSVRSASLVPTRAPAALVLLFSDRGRCPAPAKLRRRGVRSPWSSGPDCAERLLGFWHGVSCMDLFARFGLHRWLSVTTRITPRQTGELMQINATRVFVENRCRIARLRILT